MEDNRIVLGYDLNCQYVQISYMVLSQNKPETFPFREKGEKYNIPMCLCKRCGVNQWYYGDDAINCARAGDGILIEHIMEKAYKNEKIEIKEDKNAQEFDAVQLLGLFIKKSFSRMGFLLGGYDIQGLVITLDTIDERWIEVLDSAVSGLKIAREQIYFQSYEESIYHYVIHQPKELWSYQVGVLDFCGDRLKSYRVEMNHKTTPIVTTVHMESPEHIYRRKEFSSIMEKDHFYEELDEKLYQYMTHFIEGNIMTSLFLIGSGFDGEWYKHSIQYMCKGRKVFGGNNLYSKGACLSAAEKIRKSTNAQEYIFLGKDKLKSNIGIKILNGDEEVYEPILDAGMNWFDAKSELEFMLLEGNKITIIETPLMKKFQRFYNITVDGFEDRPRGCVRLKLVAWMSCESEIVIQIHDMGFGDFYPAKDQVWEQKITW